MTKNKTKQTDKTKIQDFWGALYGSLYQKVDKDITHEYLEAGLTNLENMFKYRSHMAVTEVTLDQLSGKKLLEIGPGAGGHSALFAKYGAIVTSIDITFERARSTQNKFVVLNKVGEGCQALQGDAEKLPFRENYFDIIYSNGVLHHTPNTKEAISEIHRLLKPGGRAVIMLYCKDSWHYWINMLLFVGILQGKLFYDFKLVRLQKAEFYFYLIPILGKLYRLWQKNTMEHTPAANWSTANPGQSNRPWSCI